MIPVKVRDLGITVLSEKRAEKEIKHSGFFITISTNKRPASDEEAQECAEILRKGMASMFSNDGLQQIVRFLIEGHTWSTQYINNVDAEFVVEKGRHPKGGRIHAHAVLHIEHRSRINLNFKAMKDFLMNKFPDEACVKNIYLHVRMIKTDRNLHFYLRKEIGIDSQRNPGLGPPSASATRSDQGAPSTRFDDIADEFGLMRLK